MLPTKQFERDLADLTPDQFEQLVAALVRKEHANAQKLKAPDFGADVLDDPASRRPRVWQVKHYPDRISWTLCKESLDRAVAKWRPREVIFVFPRDLTGKDHQEFNDELVGKHLVPVERWTASRLNEALEEPPAIRRSFFPHRTDTLHEILRAAQLSTAPAEGPAFLKHGLDLAKLTEELDPNFDYELRSRPASTPAATWEQPPFMTAALIGEGRESMIVAWTKAEATVAPATWAFNDDEEGEIARERLYRALARGEAVDLTGGITVRADPAPRAIKTIMGELTPDALHRATLSITPAPETVPLTVCLSGHPLRQRFDFNLRAAPPKPLDDGAWVGLASGVPVRGIPRGREASHGPSSIQPDALHDALGSGERDGHDDNAGVAHASAAHREPARRR